MRASLVLLGTVVAGAMLAASAAAQAPAPVPTADPRELCARMPAEPGETKVPAIRKNELIGGGPVGLCTIEIVDDPRRSVALHLIGFTGPDACSALQRARGKLRSARGAAAMSETPLTLPGADRAVAFRSPRSGFAFQSGAILACRGPDLVLGTVGVGTRSGIGAEMEMLEGRVRGTLSGPAPVQGSGLAMLEPLIKSFPDEFLRKFGSREAFVGSFVQQYRDLPYDLRGESAEFLAAAAMKLPDGRPAFPSLGTVLPVLRQLAINAESDPRAGRALKRFGQLVMQMDARAALDTPPPVP